nr:uncharacterized protein LOC108064816 [Drosophila takahashii]
MAKEYLYIPQWLTVQFLTEVLSGHEKEKDLEVTNLDLTQGCVEGDNYICSMYRAKVEYKTQKATLSKTLIIKTVSEGYAVSASFINEIGMYKKVLPEFEKILREKNDTTKLHAECIYYSLEPRQVIIFEDLVEKGYAMVQNRLLTDEEICRAYTKLAKVHAVSMKFINERPEFLKEFNDGICLLESPCMKCGMDSFTSFLGRIPELKKYQSHFEKIELNFTGRLWEAMKEYQTKPQPGYYVLCHGDFQTKNVMFKHNKETGSLEDCMLLDYQGSYVAPLAVDLMYSIYMIMGREQRTEKLETLLNHYFSVLLETLRKIGYQGIMPTPQTFWAEVKRLKDYEFLFLSTYLPWSQGVWLRGYESYSNAETDQKLKEFIEECKIMLARFESSGYFAEL